MIEKHLTIEECAERLAVSPERVRQFVREGRLKAERVGARLLVVRESDLKAFEKQPRERTGRPPSAKSNP
jgi:excisionase family DNA binding protein